MNEKADPSNPIPLTLTNREAIILVNAINESLEALEDWEYSSRVGASRAEAERLRAKISKLLDANPTE